MAKMLYHKSLDSMFGVNCDMYNREPHLVSLLLCKIFSEYEPVVEVEISRSVVYDRDDLLSVTYRAARWPDIRMRVLRIVQHQQHFVISGGLRVSEFRVMQTIDLTDPSCDLDEIGKAIFREIGGEDGSK